MPMQQLASNQNSPEVPVNENFSTLEHQATYGKNPPTTSGLTWGYCGGRWGGFLVAPGTFALDASDISYLVVDKSDGTHSADTDDTDWLDTANFARVYQITTNASAVTAVEDHRAGPNGVQGGGATPPGGTAAADVAVTDTGDFFAGGNVEAVLQEVGEALAAIGPPVVATETSSNRDMANDDSASSSRRGLYIRFDDSSAQTATFQEDATEPLDDDVEFYLRCVDADLTLVADGAVVLTPPAGGTLVLSAGMSVMVKRVAADVFDVIGQTVPV